MGEHALTVKVVRDGPDRALIVSGGLDFTETGGFLRPMALAVGDRPGRLTLDLAGVTSWTAREHGRWRELCA